MFGGLLQRSGALRIGMRMWVSLGTYTHENNIDNCIKKQNFILLYVGFIFRSLENFSYNYGMKNNFSLVACIKSLPWTLNVKWSFQENPTVAISFYTDESPYPCTFCSAAAFWDKDIHSFHCDTQASPSRECYHHQRTEVTNAFSLNNHFQFVVFHLHQL